MQKNKVRCGTVRVFSLMLCLLLAFGAVGCRRADAPLTPGLSVIQGEPIYDKDVAMKTDNFTVTPGMMAYFFYSYGATVLSGIEQFKTYDPEKPLHDQAYSDTLSFYDAIMNETLTKVSRMLIYCEAARAAGVSLTEEQSNEITAQITGMRMEAAINYDQELEDYLKATYGPKMTEEDLEAVLQLETLANSYSLTVERELEESITQQQALDFAKEHGIEDNTPSRNISFLYVPYAWGEPNEEILSAALEALEQEPVHDTLLAFTERSTPGKESNMTPENCGVEEICTWLFVPERRVGDVGRVELNGATYILLYTGDGRSCGEINARMQMFDGVYAEWYNAQIAGLHFGYNYDCLDSYDKK